MILNTFSSHGHNSDMSAEGAVLSSLAGFRALLLQLISAQLGDLQREGSCIQLWRAGHISDAPCSPQPSAGVAASPTAPTSPTAERQ